jgi:hypothetical protein
MKEFIGLTLCFQIWENSVVLSATLFLSQVEVKRQVGSRIGLIDSEERQYRVNVRGVKRNESVNS